MENLLQETPAVLATTPARWLSLTESLPEELLTRTPAPGQWSARECLSHLLDAERDIFPMRVRAFLAGQDFAAFNPDEEGTRDEKRPTRELAEEFASRRRESLALLRDLAPADLTRTVLHSELGQVTLAELLYEWGAHDLNHTVQGERALMQPFIVGSGPWRTAGYFADHDVEA